MVFCRNFIFYTGQYAQLAFNRYIKLMSIFNDFLSQSNVFFVRQMRTVNHYRREAEVYTRFAEFERISMVKVKNDLRMFATHFLSVCYSTFSHVTQQSLVCIVTCAFRYLKNNRRFSFNRSLDDSLQLFHIVEVESRNSIATLNCSSKHISSVYQT